MIKHSQHDILVNTFIQYYKNQYESNGANKPPMQIYDLLTSKGYKNKLTVSGVRKVALSGTTTPKGTPLDGVVAKISSDVINVTEHFFTPINPGEDISIYDSVPSFTDENLEEMSDWQSMGDENSVNRLVLVETGDEPNKPYFFLNRLTASGTDEEILAAVKDEILEKLVVDLSEEGSFPDYPNTIEVITVGDKKVIRISSPSVSGDIDIWVDTNPWVDNLNGKVIQLKPDTTE